MHQGLRIGELATRAGVNIQTLRFYERRGLLAEPPRSRSGYRQYPFEAVALVRFIKRAQELGFSLAEVEQLLALRGPETRCAEVRRVASGKLAEIDSKLRRLHAVRDALCEMVAKCGRSGDGCPLLAALDDEDVQA